MTTNNDNQPQHADALAAVEFAITKLRALLDRPRFPPARSRDHVELRRHLPYIIHDARRTGTQILVNREYKPIGSDRPYQDFIDYASQTQAHVHLTPEAIASIVRPDLERGLFNDRDPPWSGRAAAMAYLQLSPLTLRAR